MGYVGDITISTVFLGLNHQFNQGGPPMIFETMLFGGPSDNEMVRSSTWEEAERVHWAAVETVRQITGAEYLPAPPGPLLLE